MTELIFAFNNFSKAPKILIIIYGAPLALQDKSLLSTYIFTIFWRLEI